MEDFLNRVFVEPFAGPVDQLLHFIPDLMAAILLLVTGVAVSIILRALVLKLLQVLAVDKRSEAWEIMKLLKKGGVSGGFSALVSRLVFWVAAIFFFIVSLNALKLAEVNALLAQFFQYLPNIFVAIVIIVAGSMLSNFLGKAALVWSVNSGFSMAGYIGRLVRLAIMLLAVTMAMEQLGIVRTTLLVLFAILFGGIVFGLALAFGLGGKDIARDFLEKRTKPKEKKDEIEHL